MRKLKIVLVDDNDAFRKALKSLIDCEINAEIIAEVSNVNQLRKISDLSYADIILMDIMLPGTDGISFTKKLLWEYPRLKVVAITMHVERVYLVSLIETGFVGCISKDKIYTELKPAIKRVLSGKRYFPDYLPVSH